MAVAVPSLVAQCGLRGKTAGGKQHNSIKDDGVTAIALLPAPLGPHMQRALDVDLVAEVEQPAALLSKLLPGGEAQRIKLAGELARRATGRTLYILDEPTTGLHFADIERLLAVLQRLVDAGNTVLVIEHNLDVIKTADWVIDIGPEGGSGGGQLVAMGTPEQVTTTPGSYTGAYLREKLAG